MENTINIANTGHSKTSIPVASSSTNASTNTSMKGSGGVDADDSSASVSSFHDSIKKIYNESKQSEAKADDEVSGKSAPILEELTAKDDRPLLPDSLTVINQLPDKSHLSVQSAIVQPQPLSSPENTEIETAASMDVEIQIETNVSDELNQPSLAAEDIILVDAGLNVLSPQLRQNLKTGLNTDGKNAVDSIKTIAGSMEKSLIQSSEILTPTTEKSLLQSAEILPSSTVKPLNQSAESITLNSDKPVLQSSETISLNKGAFELIADKALNVANSISQQQTLPNIQAALLQTTPAQIDAAGEGLPLITSPVVNNFSSMNLQALPQAEITAALGRPEWSQGMGKQILSMVNQNIGTAEIRLNPAHLGPIEILIDMSDDQVNVSMSSRHAVVREAMEQALPKLREMLDENGFNLADTDISKHSFAEQRQQNTKNDDAGMIFGSNNPSAVAEKSEQLIHQVLQPAGMVDYYI